MSQTNIISIRITPIAVGDPPLLNAAGLHAPYALRTIIEVETKAGITGISEIPGSAAVNRSLSEVSLQLIGGDVFKFNIIRQRIVDFFKKENADRRGNKPWDQRKAVHIISAMEVACLDIIGKELNRPLSDLLGGAYREQVPFAAYLFYKYQGAGGELGHSINPDARGWAAIRQAQALSPEEILEQAVSMCLEHGFKSIKLKGGVFEPSQEIKALQLLKQTFGPHIPLRYDPNAVWKLATALQWANPLEGVLEYLEDPVRGQQNMAALRKALAIPIATNMCTTSFDQLPASIRLGSEDIILCDHHFWGGIRACLKLYDISRIFNRQLSMHSNTHLGVSLAAMAHLGAALPTIDFAFDTHYPWQQDEVIEGGRLTIEDGQLTVPGGPGLGVTIDPKALERLHQNFVHCGLQERNDEVEMQKIHAGWKFQETRW